VIGKERVFCYLNVIHDILTISLIDKGSDKNTFDAKIAEVNKLIIKSSNKDRNEFDNRQIKHFNDTAGCDFVIESLNI
jgi:hypothetical protein